MTTKVAFVKDKVDGEVVAVFPEEWYNHLKQDVVMYVHMGQHTCGSLEWARDQEKATIYESADLFNELEAIGYDLELTSI